MRIFKFLLFFGVAGFTALVGYAYMGALEPDPQPVNLPVTLNGD